jgi:membrane-associated phospholipid phosphatase
MGEDGAENPSEPRPSPVGVPRGGLIRAPRCVYSPQPHDLWSAALFLAFALFSLLWPDTGSLILALPRGYAVAAFLGLAGALALYLGRRDFSASPRVLRFVRCFYPQAFFAPLFTESILLSGRAMGGLTHDAFFARLDSGIFGFQPAREFSGLLGHLPWVNELMFGAYFSFYLMFTVTPWIPWLRGNEAEGERESSILAGFMLVVYIFYVFFRVVGPKHYLTDLSQPHYGQLPGGLFTAMEGRILRMATTTGAAFPSTHVGVSLLMTLFVAKTARRLLPFYILDTILISLATVYVYAHWAMDVAGGLFAAVLLLPLFSLAQKLLLAHRPRAKPLLEGT